MVLWLFPDMGRVSERAVPFMYSVKINCTVASKVGTQAVYEAPHDNFFFFLFRKFLVSVN